VLTEKGSFTLSDLPGEFHPFWRKAEKASNGKTWKGELPAIKDAIQVSNGNRPRVA
jgi:hypothetical protein